MSFIIVNNIRKTYFLGKTPVHALKGLSININRGEYICIAGPSGAGKSTLLNIIGLLDEPSEGILMFDNKNIFSMKEKHIHKFRKKRIGFIFQSFNLIPVFNVYENIELPLLLQKIKKKERESRIMELTEAIGIDGLLTHRSDELSGGERQRVAIARALAIKPELILADEPTANLDSVTGQKILELIQKLNEKENVTFLIASHDSTIMNKAKRIIKIKDGVIEN